MTMTPADAREVDTDSNLIEGIFRLGARYHIRTPTYQYQGTLEAVTGMVYVFSDTGTVYETGAYPEYFAGRAKDYQPHVGAGRLIVERAGVVLHEMKHKNV